MSTSSLNDAAATGDDPLLIEAAALRAHPAFKDALREYAIGVAKMRESPWLANKIISQDARFRVVGYLLYLDADRETWPGGASYGRLHELCTRRKEVNPRVLNTILSLLKFTGFVETTHSPTDKRLKFYRPTARMWDFVRDWLGYATRALDLLQPDIQRSRLLHEDPSFVRRFLASAGQDHMTNQPPADLMPEFIEFFGSREGASAAVLSAMLSDMNRSPVPSRAKIAKLYGLSKTQVSNVIALGVQSGFFLLDEDAVPMPTPHLQDSFRKWVAIELAFYARHMRPAG
jgi:DNA-binding PadR family transcriptional regulator